MAISSQAPSLDPHPWMEMLAQHAAKRDMFSARTLMTILEGVEKLAHARSEPASAIKISSFHASLFERLQQSFNNPALLKEVGLLYLNEFLMPGMALKHFDLARQFAPRDRDVEQLQKAATLALARQATDQPIHSGLDEAPHTKPEVSRLIRKTARLDMIETRKSLDEATVELERKQIMLRKTGSLRQKIEPAQPDFSEVLDYAQKATAQTDFASAFAALAEAQRIGAPNEELQAYYAQLGLTAFDHLRLEEALQAFLLSRDLVPDSVESWFNCGLVYQRMGQFDEALTAYRQAVRLAPNNAKTWCNLSAVWFELGNYGEAEKTARRALELKTDYARAWDNLASALGAENRLEQAATACQQAIHLQPGLHSAWFKLGVINFQMDNMVAAAEAFNLTGDNPDYFAYVLFYFSMIEARRGELDQALQKLEQARAADPNNDLEVLALKELGAAFTRFGRHVTAADYYTQITARRPDDFSAWLAMGTSCHRAERLDQARVAYDRAADLQPDNPAAWHNLGLLASDQGMNEESRDCFQRAVDLSPGDAKAWYDLGVSLQGLGQEVESAAAFSKAEELVNTLSRRSSDLSAALSIVRRLNLGERVLKTE